MIRGRIDWRRGAQLETKVCAREQHHNYLKNGSAEKRRGRR